MNSRPFFGKLLSPIPQSSPVNSGTQFYWNRRVRQKRSRRYFLFRLRQCNNNTSDPIALEMSFHRLYIMYHCTLYFDSSSLKIIVDPPPRRWGKLFYERIFLILSRLDDFFGKTTLESSLSYSSSAFKAKASYSFFLPSFLISF